MDNKIGQPIAECTFASRECGCSVSVKRITSRPRYLRNVLQFYPRRKMETFRSVSSEFNTIICTTPPAQLPRWLSLIHI